MKRVLNILLLILFFAGSYSESYAKSLIVSPGGKFDTRFLIVIDRESYNAAKVEVHGYKEVLEEEGLGVTILAGEWETPDDLKKEILKLYKKKPIIEGAVFIGDIPIVRVRNFQHATTAFKMNEETFPIEESSVTSDRFYDDLDLEFEFIEVDKENPRHFYYKLKESSPQVIESDFYSARMLPPPDLTSPTLGVDSYFLLKRYLVKVIDAHREINYADNIKFFNGHGYNSDCLTVWQNQQFAMEEQFPEAFNSSRGNAFYNFRQDPFMKFKLYERMQKEGTDLFVFHEHGAFHTQYINGDYPAPYRLGLHAGGNISLKEDGSYPGVIGPLEAFSIQVRNRYRRYSGDKKDAFKEDVIKEYGLAESFFDAKLIAKTRKSDSAFAANSNIVLSDLKGIKPQSKITIFDACYNGSFHKPGYIAGYHIFGEGNTIVTQGNTVNVLQDKWSMELIGMLAQGARVGFWQKEVQTLESHLIGDPTYSFTPGSPAKSRSFEAFALNKNLALNSKDNKIWKTYLKSDIPVYQAIALSQLTKNPPKGFDNELMKYLQESPFYMVRMQALKALIDLRSKKLPQALVIAFEDPYELIRRNAARFAGYCGHPSLIAPLVHEIAFSDESQRVQYAAQGSLDMFEFEAVKSEILQQIESSNLLHPDKATESLVSYFLSKRDRNISNLKIIKSKQNSAQERISAIRYLRNYNNHLQVEELLDVLADSSNETAVRVALAEAFGWFRWSVKKDLIMERLHKIYKERGIPKELKAEIQQTILRLKSI
ncbi:MAG: HEAT repeat domain-containing protein [Bacteroidales bacterium]|nr:HEAT repeat domain-containing protein [Bacteroidales bacterium]